MGLRCCVQLFSSCGERGLCFDVMCGLLTAPASCWETQALGCVRFRSCSPWAQWLRCTGLVAPQRVESFWTRDWTCVPCIGKWILNHWTTREVLKSSWIEFLTQHNFLEIYPGCCIYWKSVPFFLRGSIPWHEYTTEQLPLEDNLSCFQFLDITNKTALNICVGFCVNVSLPLLGINAQE